MAYRPSERLGLSLGFFRQRIDRFRNPPRRPAPRERPPPASLLARPQRHRTLDPRRQNAAAIGNSSGEKREPRGIKNSRHDRELGRRFRRSPGYATSFHAPLGNARQQPRSAATRHAARANNAARCRAGPLGIPECGNQIPERSDLNLWASALARASRFQRRKPQTARASAL